MMIAIDGEFESASGMIEAIKAHREQLLDAMSKEDQQALEAIKADPDVIEAWMDAAFDESMSYIILPGDTTKAA